MYRTWLRYVVAPMLLLCLLIIGYGYWLISGTSTQSVDYLARLNEPILATAEDQRAWPVLAQAMLAFKLMPDALSELEFEKLHPDSEHWPTVEKWLLDNKQVLPILLRAAHKTHYGYLYGSKYNTSRELIDAGIIALPRTETEPVLVNVLLPSLATLRQTCKYLVLQSREELLQGDYQSAWELVEVARNIALKLSNSNTLVEQLVGFGMLDMCHEQLRRNLQSPPPAQSLYFTQRILESDLLDIEIDSIAKRAIGEKVLFDDVVQTVFTDNGDGDGRIIPRKLMRLIGVEGDSETITEQLFIALTHADRLDTAQEYERLWNDYTTCLDLELDDPLRSDCETPMVTWGGNLKNIKRYALIREFLPSMDRYDVLLREGSMHAHTVKLIAVLQAHRHNHGQYPESLKQIPAKQQVSADDIYSPGLLIYKPGSHDNFLLYSVGPNLKDDSGAADSDDLVYWPVLDEN